MCIRDSSTLVRRPLYLVATTAMVADLASSCSILSTGRSEINSGSMALRSNSGNSTPTEEGDEVVEEVGDDDDDAVTLSLIHISEPTRLLSISYAVFCLKKKKQKIQINNF
eukprot:TRINITY_DN56332_c0_g1_i1.p1 TRINITY_DN56332_c0_g1~~TRINITY_DN56332_c0_g1_i1.p1  ORF type:complete len:111 (-),score=16.12 TRINITY_DN56332_c0_g1_i1:24-356(-)